MFTVHLLLAVLVTIQATEAAVVARICVAVVTTVPGLALTVVSLIDREPVTKLRPGPLRCRVTGFTTLREAGRCVIGIGDVVVLRLVTGIAIGWRAAVNPVDVAIGATGFGAMSPG